MTLKTPGGAIVAPVTFHQHTTGRCSTPKMRLLKCDTLRYLIIVLPPRCRCSTHVCDNVASTKTITFLPLFFRLLATRPVRCSAQSGATPRCGDGLIRTTGPNPHRQAMESNDRQNLARRATQNVAGKEAWRMRHMRLEPER